MMGSALRRRPGGFTLIELLTGTAIGLFVIAVATGLFTGQVAAARRLQVEARLQQDLRATADLMVRELRRSGYWGRAVEGLTGSNPYTNLAVDGAMPSIVYALSRDAAENGTVDLNERFGFRLNRSEHTIQMLTGSGTWQSLTDPGTVTIPDDGLVLALSETPVDLRKLCPTACTGADCPAVVVRQVTLELAGRAAADPRIVRRLQARVRLRNDSVTGRCPD